MAHIVLALVLVIPVLQAPVAAERREDSQPGARCTAEPGQAATDAERSQLQAWELLASALRHHAPEGLRQGRALELEWRGVVRPRSQSRTAEPPFEPPFPLLWRASLGPDLERVVLHEELQWPDFLARHRSVVTADDAFDVDLASGRVTPPFREPGELLASLVRQVPPLLLAESRRDAPGSLRFAGVVERDGEGLHVVSAVHRGERLDLHLAADGGLAGWGRMTSQPMLGDAYETVRFSGTSEAAGLVLPARSVRSLGGNGILAELELVTASWGDLDPALLERPPSSSADEGDAAAGPASAAAATAEEPAPGVFLFPVPGHPDYRSLVVERDDHLVLVEAPVSEAATRDLLAAVEGRFPGKPLRWVVATHHHFDHSAGVPAALVAGATLLTTPGNVGFFRRAVTGPRTLEGPRTPEGEATGRASPAIRTVEESWSIPGGPPEVAVVRVEPNPHAAEMLAVHLPAAGLLFQGDLARFPLPPDEPLRPQVEALRRLVRALDGEIERIAGVHGAVGTVAELEARWAAGEPGSPAGGR